MAALSSAQLGALTSDDLATFSTADVAAITATALAGLKIFQTKPPMGVRVNQADGAHYLQYSGLPGLKVLNGFI